MEIRAKQRLAARTTRQPKLSATESSREAGGLTNSRMYANVGLGPDTLPERIYERIREMILRAEIAPGEKLLPARLAEAFHVSVTPMREAFRLLEQENLVDIVPRKGAIVSPIMSKKQVEELYTVRLALEQLAVRLVVAHSTDSMWDALSQAAEEYGKAMKADDFEPALMWDMRFHSVIVHSSGNELLEQIFEKLSNQIQILRRMDRGQTRRLQSDKEHHLILQAFKSRDEKRALEVLENHITSGRRHVLEFLDRLHGSSCATLDREGQQ